MVVPFPWDSILEAVFTVSPNKQYLGMLNPTTPVTIAPKNITHKIRPHGLQSVITKKFCTVIAEIKYENILQWLF